MIKLTGDDDDDDMESRAVYWYKEATARERSKNIETCYVRGSVAYIAIAQQYSCRRKMASFLT